MSFASRPSAVRKRWRYPHGVPDGFDLFRGGPPPVPAFGSEAPEIHERADGGIEGAAAGFGEIERAADHMEEAGGNLHGFVGPGPVEPRNFAVGLIGGHLAVDFHEHGVDIAVQALKLLRAQGRIGEADGVGRAHGRAGQAFGAGGRGAGRQGDEE